MLNVRVDVLLAVETVVNQNSLELILIRSRIQREERPRD